MIDGVSCAALVDAILAIVLDPLLPVLAELPGAVPTESPKLDCAGPGPVVLWPEFVEDDVSGVVMLLGVVLDWVPGIVTGIERGKLG